MGEEKQVEAGGQVAKIGKAIHKVEGGKLVKVHLILGEERIIHDIKIMGDFFMHPEHEIENLEKALKGIKAHPDELKKKMKFFMERVEVIGVEEWDFIHTIMMAAENL